MTIWPPQPGTLRRPAYRSLAQSILDAIESGDLNVGDRLPTHRNLAYDLGLSVQTVSRAYDELIRRGAITGEVGRGTFIRTTRNEARVPYLPRTPDEPVIDFSLLKPVLDGSHEAAMRKVLQDISQDLPATVFSSFRPAVALGKYKPTVLKWLARCGIELGNQGIMITNGSSSAMHLAMLTVANSGDLVAADALTHHTLKPLARYLGIRLRGLPCDEAGMLPDALDIASRRDGVKAVFLMPAGLGPQARILPETRRRELAEVARKHDLAIIENDAWGPLERNRAAPMAALAPERTFYFTGFSKCAMPGLRLGFLVMPDTYEAAAANRHLVTNWTATPLMAEIAARWIEDGTAQRFVTNQAKQLAIRNRRAANILKGIKLRHHPTSMHIWLELPDSWSEDDFVAHARQHGVAIAPGSAFAVNDDRTSCAVRICIGGMSLAELEEGLSIIGRLVRGQSEPALLTI